MHQGYRRLALIAGRPDAAASYGRERGFRDFLAKQGLSDPAREVGFFRRHEAMKAMRNLLSRKPRPDAVFCENDDMALAALEVARFEFGLEIGRDLGIAGFDDTDQAGWPSFDLTTYSFPVEKVSECVTHLVTDPSAAFPVKVIVPGDLKICGSTRP